MRSCSPSPGSSASVSRPPGACRSPRRSACRRRGRAPSPSRRAPATMRRSRSSWLSTIAMRAAVTAERAFLAELGAGCLAPAAALARVLRDRLVLDAMFQEAEDGVLQRDTVSGGPDEAAALGASLAGRLLRAGRGA